MAKSSNKQVFSTTHFMQRQTNTYIVK